MAKPVCLITGVGDGTGAALARRFAETYRVAMLARNQGRLRSLEDELEGARGYICDVGDLEALEAGQLDLAPGDAVVARGVQLENLLRRPQAALGQLLLGGFDSPAAALLISLLLLDSGPNDDPQVADAIRLDAGLLDYDGDNLIVTPHIAWATNEARQKAIGELAANAIAFMNGEKRNRVV